MSQTLGVLLEGRMENQVKTPESVKEETWDCPECRKAWRKQEQHESNQLMVIVGISCIFMGICFVPTGPLSFFVVVMHHYIKETTWNNWGVGISISGYGLFFLALLTRRSYTLYCFLSGASGDMLAGWHVHLNNNFLNGRMYLVVRRPLFGKVISKGNGINEWRLARPEHFMERHYAPDSEHIDMSVGRLNVQMVKLSVTPNGGEDVLTNTPDLLWPIMEQPLDLQARYKK